ncbi:KS1 protein-like [Gossypium australe]|uniref:KS1 protein-like n=1 Tax=Gossypium australe TaxID=47621 RepID=A0A5B6VSB5_9ROSI|nr:KS1 protein-like [Gossypium australe]
MRRGRGKVKKQAVVVSSREDPASGDDEIVEEFKVEKTEEDSGDIKGSVPIKEMKNQTVTENGRKRKRSMQAKENGITTKLSTNDSIKPVGYRQNGSRRKNKPQRAAEAISRNSTSGFFDLMMLLMFSIIQKTENVCVSARVWRKKTDGVKALVYVDDLCILID